MKKKSNAKRTAPAPVSKEKDGLSTSVQMISVQPGLYMLSVQSGAAGKTASGAVRLPAITVNTAPGMSAERVQFLPGHNVVGNWLSASSDLLVVKVSGGNSTLAITSLRMAGTDELKVRFERLTADRSSADAPPVPAAKAPAAPPAPPYQKKAGEVGLKMLLHIRGRGDTSFVETDWAGKVGRGHWIESFSISPTEVLTAQDFEYKGLTASGFESPWLSDAQVCGTRGMAMPLVGFAIRLKAGAAAAYSCEYTGYFQSGVTVGPLQNGVPCRSTAPNDPLEGIQIHVIKRNAIKRK